MNNDSIRWQIAMAHVGRLVIAMGIGLLVWGVVWISYSSASSDEDDLYLEDVRQLKAYIESGAEPAISRSDFLIIHWNPDNPEHAEVLNMLIPLYMRDPDQQDIVLTAGLRLMDKRPEWHQFIMDWRLGKLKANPSSNEEGFEEDVRGMKAAVDDELLRRAKENPSEETFADMRAIWKLGEFPTDHYLGDILTRAKNPKSPSPPFKALGAALK